jgi:23S rRNA pseudouridine1911/1915/1917 synthase
VTDWRTFQVQTEDRLDRAVVAAMPELSRSQARRLIEEGRVRVAGQEFPKAATAVPAGAVFEVSPPVVPNLDLVAEDVPLDVLFEDEETLVLNKQPGLIVHPRPGMNAVTLLNAVRVRYPEVLEIDDSDRGGIVHRLDRDTSGAIALAKSEAAQGALKEQWRNRETLKVYLALAVGRVMPPEGVIEAPLGPDPADPRRRTVIEDGQTARSQYAVVEQYGDEAALLEVQIFTGRTHQIRVHLQAIGHSVMGDGMYGQPSALIGRQALHASRLGFTLPSTGEWREFEAPVPEDFAQVVRMLRSKHLVTARADEVPAVPA